jgi:cell shape-determining protein MreD
MELKAKKLQVVGSLYFIVLSLAGIATTIIYHQTIGPELLVLFLAIVAYRLNNRNFNLTCGIIGAILSVYVGIACFIFNLQAGTTTSSYSFLLGYLVAISSFVASSFLVYAGLDTQSDSKLHVS